MPTEPIRIRITTRTHSETQAVDARHAFWTSVRDSSQYDAEDPDKHTPATYEAKIRRRFGIELRQALVRHLSEPLESASGAIPGDERYLLHRAFERPRHGKGGDYFDYSEYYRTVAQVAEQRHRFLLETPGLKDTFERIAAAGSITFHDESPATPA